MPRTRNPDTRENILTAAQELFSSNGYHDTSVSDIIKAVGMSQGSFYNYFKSKKDIFKVVLEEYCTRIQDITKEFPLDQVKGPIEYVAIVYRLGESLTNIFTEDINLTRIFFWEAVGIEPEFDNKLDETYQAVTGYSRGYLEKGQELGIIRKDIDTLLVASATIGMATHLINRYLRGDYGEIDKSRLTQTILDIQLNGVLIKDSGVNV